MEINCTTKKYIKRFIVDGQKDDGEEATKTFDKM